MSDPLTPEAPGTAGDTLGGAEAPTSNDGSLGGDAPSGDAGLAGDVDPVTGGAGSDPLPQTDDVDPDDLTDDEGAGDQASHQND